MRWDLLLFVVVIWLLCFERALHWLELKLGFSGQEHGRMGRAWWNMAQTLGRDTGTQGGIQGRDTGKWNWEELGLELGIASKAKYVMATLRYEKI